MMSVVAITPCLPPYGGGIGVVARAHAHALARLGHDVHLLVLAHTDKRITPIEGVRITELPALIKSGLAGISIKLNEHLAAASHIHLHYPSYGLQEELYWYLKSANTQKLMVTYHMDVVGDSWRKYVSYILDHTTLPMLMKRAQGLQLNSEDYYLHSRNRNALKLFRKTPLFLPHGVNVQAYTPGADTHQVGNMALLFVGSLDRAHYFKGLDVLLRALKIFIAQRDKFSITLDIVGEGPMRKLYMRKVQQLGLNPFVRFRGHSDEQTLTGYYQRADLLVFPSTDASEAFGLVQVEALASGTPVLASDLPGVRTIAMSSGGWLVRPNDVHALVAGLRNAYVQLQQSGESIRKRAREVARSQYDWDRIGKTLEHYMRTL